MPIRTAAALSFLPLLVLVTPVSAQETSPLQFSGTYHLRFENLDNAYRAGVDGGDQLLASRLLASARYNRNNIFGEAELLDSRTWLDDAGTPLGVDDVNTLEPLQLYAGWRQDAGENGRFSMRGGRMSFDIGSRRLFSRSRFRNTLSSFTGVHADLQRENWRLQALYVLPAQARPSALNGLDSNEQELDREESGQRFWGLHSTWSGFRNFSALEMYWFTLEEEDAKDFATRNRDIDTVGVRVLKSPASGEWDYEFEGALQRGESRASAAAADLRDLDHRAFLVHAHVGYQFDDNWASRLVLQADYASGDEDPGDGENNRFDSLFGARPFDFGPAGIYGAYARSNVFSPTVRWEFRPAAGYSAYMGYRAGWVAEARDAHTTSNVRDITGRTGRFLGHQIETRFRFPLHERIQGELGGAYLHKGEFLHDAPNAPDTGHTTYWYAQATYQF